MAEKDLTTPVKYSTEHAEHIKGVQQKRGSVDDELTEEYFGKIIEKAKKNLREYLKNEH